MRMENEEKIAEKKKSLFEIVGDSMSLINELLYQGGEFTEEMEKQFENLETDLVNKVDAYYAIMDRMKIEQEYLEEKAAEFTKTAKTLKSANARMKDAVKGAMVNLKKDELVGDNWRFKLGKLPDKMVIEDSKVHLKYYSDKITSYIDKDKITADLNFGQNVAGVSFIENYSLRRTVAKKGKK